MVHMEFTVLDTVLILWDMVMAILAMPVDMVLVMDLDTVHTPLDMDMDMAMVMDMDIMVELSDTTNQAWHYNDKVPPQCIMVRIFYLVCFKYRLSFHSDSLLCISKYLYVPILREFCHIL